MDNKTMLGNFYGIGIGPGDPELLTIKAVRIINEADYIFVPKASFKNESLALDIVKDFVVGKKICEQVYPMTKDKSVLDKVWMNAAIEIAGKVKTGNKVVYLTIGDPLTFSTYIYLLQNLLKLIPGENIETIPGITSYNAAACLANLPLIESNMKLAVVPVSKDIEELRPILQSFDTIVLMKVAKKLDAVIELLEELNLADSSLFASYVGQENSFITRNLIALKGKEKGYMSVIIVTRNH
ncbi:MAG: precorrin-2 C(20)-methyltransferase [Candidatus Anammoxibacter sp.]